MKSSTQFAGTGGSSLADAARLSIAACLFVAILPSFAAAQNVIGINAAVHNLVQIRTGSSPARHAVVRERVKLNDEVRTGPASQLQIMLLDRSNFTVGANARIVIDRFVYDARGGARAVAATVMRGAFRFISGRSLAAASGSRSVRTPVGTIAIRGTILEGVVGADAIRVAAAEAAVGADVGGDPETATLILLRGPGAQAQGGIAAGAVDVMAGDKSFALDAPLLALYVPGKGLPPIGPFTLSDAGILAVEQLVRPQPLAAATAAEDGVPDGDRRSRTRRIVRWVPLLLAAAASLYIVRDLSDEPPASP